MSVKFAPQLPKAEQKTCLSVASKLLKQLEASLFKNTVTVDETWVYSYDPQTKQKSLQRKHVHHQEPRKHAKFAVWQR
jgi:hypothetical protein